MRRRRPRGSPLAWPAVAFVVALVAFRAVRHYPWPLAAIVALAVAALTFASLRAGREIRRAWLERWQRQDEEP